MPWSAFAGGTSGASCRRECSTRAWTSPTPTSRWSWAAPSGSVNTSSAWVGCCGPARASEPSYMSSSREIPSKSVRRGGDAWALASADLLSYSVAGTVVIPHYLGEHDHPWLRVLLEEHERFIGRPQRELEARLRDPLPCESPPRKLRLAIQVLGRLRARNRKSAVLPSRARAHVFGEAARTWASPQAVLTSVAASLGVTLEDLQESLFADLPGERIVAVPGQPLSAVELALRCNLAVVQEMLFRATVIRLEIEG